MKSVTLFEIETTTVELTTWQLMALESLMDHALAGTTPDWATIPAAQESLKALQKKLGEA